MTNYLQWLLEQGRWEFWLNEQMPPLPSQPDWTVQTVDSPSLPQIERFEAGSSSLSMTEWLESEQRRSPLPVNPEDVLQTERMSSPSAPAIPESQWSLPEQVDTPSRQAAPLTAAELDRLFERDARRYDQGFALL